MAENSKIEWTDHTFNPWIGCTKVSPGCDNCYAEAREDKRLHRVQWGPGQPRQRTKTWGDPVRWNKVHEAFFAQHGRRQRVFCASLADVFDNEVDDQWRCDLFELIRATPNLDWLLLTKRIGNVQKFIQATGQLCIPANVWLGVTIVNQEEADRDIPKLLDTPARVRFLSMEPLLGPVDIRRFMWPVHGWWKYPHRSYAEAKAAGGECGLKRQALVSAHARFLDWVIVGGESGHGARPMHPDWARSLRDQCAAADVPFLFKQWGEWKPICQDDGDWYDSLYAPRVKARDHEDQGALDGIHGRRCTVPELILRIAGDHAEIAQPLAFESGAKAVQAFRVGKKAAGRLLDAVEHNGVPR